MASGAVAIGIACLAPRYGWWLLALLAASAAGTETLDLRMRHTHRPEYQAAFTILWSQAIVAAAIVLSGGPRSPLLPLIVVPTSFAATRFRTAVAHAATAVAVVLLIMATLAVEPSATIAHPTGLAMAVVLVVAMSAAQNALGTAAAQFRATAILDPLTGLLNRQGLDSRYLELAEQARLSGAPISLLICDIDNFKDINDSYGHATGDAVLRAVAYELRKQLRSFELVYRTGGDEVLIVLPGAAQPLARAMGHRLVEAIRHLRPHDVAITVSVGGATRWGAEAGFIELFAAADRALYAAKDHGRDQVWVEDTAPLPDFGSENVPTRTLAAARTRRADESQPIPPLVA
jgi:diguanylate cyclase (GGDEF)-like protein